jgi:hypothetical protein
VHLLPGAEHVRMVFVPAAFVARALIAVATDWLQRGCPGTPAEMTTRAELLQALTADTGTPAMP